MRNRAKRKMRALFLEFQERVAPGVFVFVAKKDILTTPYPQLEKSLHYALKRVGALR